MARDNQPTIDYGLYELDFAAAQYRELRMVSDDGVLLVELRVHERAQEGRDLVAELHAWREAIRDREGKEKRHGLMLVTPDAGDAS